MLTSPRCAKPAISISDPFGISDARLPMTSLFWLLMHWFNPTLIITTPYFFNMSGFNFNKLQRVQNLAARLALNDWRLLIQQIFVKLHWLPIQARIKFKICTLTYKILSENQPANLRSLITSHVAEVIWAMQIDSTANSNMHWSTCFPCLCTNRMELTPFVYWAFPNSCNVQT